MDAIRAGCHGLLSGANVSFRDDSRSATVIDKRGTLVEYDFESGGMYRRSDAPGPYCLRWAVLMVNDDEVDPGVKEAADETIRQATQRRIAVGNRCIAWAECGIDFCAAGSLLVTTEDTDEIETAPLRTDSRITSLSDCPDCQS